MEDEIRSVVRNKSVAGKAKTKAAEEDIEQYTYALRFIAANRVSPIALGSRNANSLRGKRNYISNDA